MITLCGEGNMGKAAGSGEVMMVVMVCPDARVWTGKGDCGGGRSHKVVVIKL